MNVNSDELKVIDIPLKFTDPFKVSEKKCLKVHFTIVKFSPSINY